MKLFSLLAALAVTGCAAPALKPEGAPLPVNSNYSSVPSLSCPNDKVVSDRYAPTIRRDTIDNRTVVSSPSIRVMGPNMEGLWVSLSKISTGAATLPVALVVLYDAKDWLFIDEGESLTIVADGQRLSFTGAGSSNNRDIGSTGLIFETAHYPITDGQIKTIAQAAAMTARVRGSKGYVDFALGQDIACSFRRFALDVL